MDYKATDQFLRIAAGVLAAIGVLAIVLGYLGVRDHADIALQLPYLMSGGLGGLTLLGLAALVLIQRQARQLEQRIARVTDELDGWKEAALREVRTFLESAELEVEIDAPILPLKPVRRRVQRVG